METYTLNTTDYDYRILQHEGFGGICKYIATPKKQAGQSCLSSTKTYSQPAMRLWLAGLPTCVVCLRRELIL